MANPVGNMEGGPRRRLPGLAVLLAACLAATSCGTTQDRARAIGQATNAADLSNVPDSQLCSELVNASPIITAERQVRGLGDCIQYRKDRESDARGNLEMVLLTRGLGAPLLMFAVAKQHEVSSRECPYKDIRSFGETTRDCPRYADMPRPADPQGTAATPAR